MSGDPYCLYGEYGRSSCAVQLDWGRCDPRATGAPRLLDLRLGGFVALKAMLLRRLVSCVRSVQHKRRAPL